ncbi:unnamed protein product, partial [Rotaria sp. Silwood1]
MQSFFFLLPILARTTWSKSPSCPSATWSQVGRTVIGGTQGNATNQLHYPVGLFIDSNDCLFIADSRNGRVIKLEQGASIGTVVAGKLHTPTDISVDKQAWDVAIDDSGTIYIADSGNNRVIKWPMNATEGILIGGGNNYGNRTDQLAAPRGVLVDHLGTVYVADTYNDRIIRIPLG